jgi:nickel-dependent lactate racemase
MNMLKLPQLAWHGTKALELPLPDGWQVEMCHIAGYDRPTLTPDQIRTAVTQNLIGTPPIREMAKGKKEVVIIFDDMTRVTRVADIVPFVIEELTEAGITDDRIRFISALGCHGAMNRFDFIKKLGESTLTRFPVYNHNPFDNCVYAGTTNYGTKVYLNAEVMKCDFKIAIGSITPHLMSGFGGGWKIILPGIASYQTIDTFHMLSKLLPKERQQQMTTEAGVIEDNPFYEDIEEGASFSGLDIKIEILFNHWGETAAVYAGMPKEVCAASISDAKTHFLTPRARDKDIVIANTFAKANEATLGILTASPSVKSSGGDIVLIANAPEGQVTHYLMGPFGKMIESKQKLQIITPHSVKHLIIFTEYPDLAGRGYFEQSDKAMFIHRWDDVVQALQEFHGDNAEVAVYPHAEVQYCR